MDRLTTGNPDIDRILGGGLPRHSINVLMGQPGAGKTILAEQLAFANATRERPAVYVATLSEPLSKFVAYLQQQTFADPERIGTEVIYETIDHAAASNPQTVVDSLQRIIQSYRPRVIAIDSFKAISDLMPDLTTWRRLLFQLAGLLSAYDTTSLWIGEYTADRISVLPEFAVADGIIELSRELRGSRDERHLRVIKLRGSRFLAGLHAFRITPAGLKVFPRLVTPPGQESYEAVEERLQSGITGLDEMISTGWLRGTSTLIAGPSGAGKTVLGLHFLREGVVRGEAGLLVSFQENETQLARIVGHFGWTPESLFGPGKLDLFYSTPVELQIDAVIGEMFARIERDGVRRIVIDAIGDLEGAARNSQRFRDFLYAMSQYFATHNLTAMLLMETGAPFSMGKTSADGKVSNLSDNVLLLQMHLNGALERKVRVLKSRGSAHSSEERTLQITPQGIVVR